jgi:hypothetical protein
MAPIGHASPADDDGGPAGLRDNPFFVLELSPDASRIEVERAAQSLLGMLELGFAAAATYPTPLGPRLRTPEQVRAAVAALRDPARRLAAELWARHVTAARPAAADADDRPGAPRSAPAAPAYPGARRALGWR